MKNYKHFIKQVKLSNEQYEPGYSYFDEMYINYRQLNEFIKNSLSVDHTIIKIEEYLNNIDIDKYCKISHIATSDDYLTKKYNLEYSGDFIVVTINTGDVIKNIIPLKFIEGILTNIKICGWYTALIEADNNKYKDVKQFLNDNKIKDFKNITFTCERKYPIEGSFNINTTLYHLTTQTKLKSIKEIGLCPKNSGTKIAYHPKRIYFCKNIECIKNFIKELEEKKILLEPLALLSIEPSELYYSTFNGNKELIYFYNDVRKKDSMYTNFNIHPKNITILKENIESIKSF